MTNAPNSGGLWAKLLALAAGLLVTVAAIEVTLRVAGWVAYPEPDVELWFDDESDSERPPLRVLCLGDSFTQGQGNANYPDQLRTLLHEALPEGEVGVYNAGLGGSNTHCVRMIAKRSIEEVRPQIVVLLVGGANKTNTFGLDAFVGRASVWSRLDALLLCWRGYRLVRHAASMLAPGFVHAHERSYAAVRSDFERYERSFSDHRERTGAAPEDRSEGYNALWSMDVALARQIFQGADYDSDPEAAFGLGTLAVLEGRPDEAERCFQRCLELDPTLAVCHLNLGMLDLDVHRDAAAALVHFEDGIRAQPEEPGNYWGAMEVAKRQGNKAVQLEWALTCMRIAPDDPGCYAGLVALSSTTEAREEILAQLRRNARRSVIARDHLTWIGSGRDPSILADWIAADIALLHEQVRDAGGRLVLQNYPDAEPENAIIARMADELGVPLVDNRSHFAALRAAGESRSELFVPDGHCSYRGYGELAAGVVEVLQREGMLDLGAAR